MRIAAFGLVVWLPLCVTGVVLAEPPQAGREPSIRLNRKVDGDKGAFEVIDLAPADLARLDKARLTPAQWMALFAVHVDHKGAADEAGPPVLGSHRVVEGVLRFEPRFPLVPGVRYRAVLDVSQLPGHEGGKKPPLAAEFTIAKPVVKATTVVDVVYPTRNILPENQLKFYIHFSAPMSRGEAYQHIKLLDAAGKTVEAPFLELGEELWDPQRRRFTLLFDPGRIKRGLKSREDEGPSIEAGKTYTFVLDRHWSDAKDQPLKEGYRKTFRVVAAEEQPIDLKTWKLQAPTVGDSGPLTVKFPRPLDHALLERLVWVTDDEGRKVPGTVKVTDEETRWQFTPERPWQAGAYQLVVDTRLEDLAGNSVGKPFEVDVFQPIQREVKAETAKLPFAVKR